MNSLLMMSYGIGNFLYRIKVPFIPSLITFLNRFVFSVWLPSQTKVGRGCSFGKGGLGVVVHSKAVIGDRCIIGNNVTIGGSSRKEKGKLPVIGSRVRIGAGAVILGDVIIGDDCLIGANSVVTSNVASNSIVVGNPARLIKSNIDIEDFVEFKN